MNDGTQIAEVLGGLRLQRARRRSVLHFARLAARGEKDSPSGTGLFKVSATTGLTVLSGAVWTDRDRSLTLTVLPGGRLGSRHVARLYTSIGLAGLVLTIPLGVVVFYLLDRSHPANALMGALLYTVIGAVFAPFLARVLTAVSGQQRRTNQLAARVLEGPVPPGKAPPTETWVVGTLAGQPGAARLYGLFRRGERLADTRRWALLASTSSEVRADQYRAAGFQEIFTHPAQPESGSVPSEWYLARYPTAPVGAR